MNTDVGLETVGEPLEHHVHVDPVRVSPGVLQIQGEGCNQNRDQKNALVLVIKGEFSVLFTSAHQLHSPGPL